MKNALLLLTALSCLGFTRGNAQLLSTSALDSMPVYTDLLVALKNPLEVYRLDLTRKKLKDFPQEIFLLVHLNELVLDKNKIIAVPNDIQTLKYLQRLSMAHNAIDSLTVSMCHLPNLKVLNLADNFIPEIPDEIENLSQLEGLFIWENPIDYYPNSLVMLTNLKELDLIHNLMNADEQDRIRGMLPNTRIHFSPPCNCDFSRDD